MQFCGISFVLPYKHSGGWQDVLGTQAHPAVYQTTYMDARKKYHKTACTSLHEDENLDVRNMSKTL